MFGLMRKDDVKSAVRAVNLYFSDSAVIVAATHQNKDGIYFEQAGAKLLEGLKSDQELGEAFQQAFEAFTVVAADLRGFKKSDWPAFQASKIRNVKQFESVFRTVVCRGLNSANVVVQASTPHAHAPEIELCISFNPSLPAEAVGEKLRRLVEIANAT
jgi:hypothetical protein